jgi:hypothetical protein
MGSGKTMTALAWSSNYDVETVVFCPEMILSQWKSEYSKLNLVNKVSIFSHETLFERYKTHDFYNKLVIIDEAHKLIDWLSLNHGSVIHFYRKLWASKKIMLLTGTPFNTKRSDISYLINLVSKKNTLPINPYEFNVKYVKSRTNELSFIMKQLNSSPIFNYVVIAVTGFIRSYYSGPFVSALGKFYAKRKLKLLVPVFTAYVSYLPISIAILIITFLMYKFQIDVDKFLDESQLDAAKFTKDVNRYLMYYNYVDEDDKDGIYPSFKEEVIQHYYSQFQNMVLIELFNQKVMTNIVAQQILEEPDGENVEYTKSVLLNDSLGVLHYGRNIGNLFTKSMFYEYKYSEDNTQIIPKDLDIVDFFEMKKIQKIYERIKVKLNDPLYKIVVYSNFKENGCITFASFLTLMKIPYRYLNNRVESHVKESLLTDFNKTDGKNTFSVLIIDQDSVAGLNLFGVRELHVMEPPKNSTDYSQLIYRAIRAFSHKHLPEKEQFVTIFNHICIVTKLDDYTPEKLFSHFSEFFEKNIPQYLNSLKYWEKNLKQQFMWIINKSKNSEMTSPDKILLDQLTVQKNDLKNIIDLLSKPTDLPKDCISTECSVWKSRDEPGTCIRPKKKSQSKKKTSKSKPVKSSKIPKFSWWR